jgi:hypothetical protein
MAFQYFSASRPDLIHRGVELRSPLSRLTRDSAGIAQENTSMKIALLVLLGLVLGALGGAAVGIGAGLASLEIFKTSSFEGFSGMLVFFTCMALGAVIGGLGGALLFGMIAIRDAEIAIEKQSARRHDNQITKS